MIFPERLGMTERVGNDDYQMPSFSSRLSVPKLEHNRPSGDNSSTAINGAS